MYDDSERAGLTTVSQFVPRFFLSYMLRYDVAVRCYGQICYGQMLRSDVTVRCYGQMLRSDVTVRSWKDNLTFSIIVLTLLLLSLNFIL